MQIDSDHVRRLQAERQQLNERVLELQRLVQTKDHQIQQATHGLVQLETAHKLERQTSNNLQSCLDDLVFRTQEEPTQANELLKIKDPKRRNEKAVELVVSNFKRLLEQSKALEDEVMTSRVHGNVGAIKNSNAQSDLQTDIMAMSLACSALADEELLGLKVADGVKRLKLNLN